MCVGVPGKIIKIEKFHGVVETKGIKRDVNLALVPEAEMGDYVMVHAGAAIQVMDEEEALATLEILEELFEYADEE